MELNDLSRTLQEALDTQRLGRLRALRVLVACRSSGRADLEERLSEILALTRRLWGSEPVRMHVMLDPTEFQMSAMAGFANGETALVTVAQANVDAESLQMTILGSGGSCRLEGGDWFVSSPPVADAGFLAQIRTAAGVDSADA